MSGEIHDQINRQAKMSAPAQKLLFYIPLAAAIGCFAWALALEVFRIEIGMESRAQFYSNFGTVSFAISIVLNTAHGRNYGLGWLKSLIFSYLSFQLVFSYLSVAWANLDIAIFGGGAVASFRSIMFLPLLCVILSRFCAQGTWNLCDYLTPYFFFHHGFVTLACWIQGCCAGRPWPWGLCNPLSGVTVFPAQPCIIILSIAVAYWGLCHSKKHAYKTNGMVFANSLIFYGFFRYLIELYTDDTRVWWVLSWISICSLAMLAQGLLVRYFAGKRNKSP